MHACATGLKFCLKCDQEHKTGTCPHIRLSSNQIEGQEP